MSRPIGGSIDDHPDQVKIYRSFGKWVREQREAAGLEQKDLAELLKCARSSVTNIEAGHQRVSLHVAVQITSLFWASLGGGIKT